MVDEPTSGPDLDVILNYVQHERSCGSTDGLRVARLTASAGHLFVLDECASAVRKSTSPATYRALAGWLRRPSRWFPLAGSGAVGPTLQGMCWLQYDDSIRRAVKRWVGERKHPL